MGGIAGKRGKAFTSLLVWSCNVGCTQCQLVTMWPLSSQMKPDPTESSTTRSPCRRLLTTETTDAAAQPPFALLKERRTAIGGATMHSIMAHVCFSFMQAGPRSYCGIISALMPSSPKENVFPEATYKTCWCPCDLGMLYDMQRHGWKKAHCSSKCW